MSAGFILQSPRFSYRCRESHLRPEWATAASLALPVITTDHKKAREDNGDTLSAVPFAARVGLVYVHDEADRAQAESHTISIAFRLHIASLRLFMVCTAGLCAISHSEATANRVMSQRAEGHMDNDGTGPPPSSCPSWHSRLAVLPA